MADDWNDFEKTLAGIQHGLAPANQRKIATRASQALQKSNIDRIKKNVNPDGSKFEPRHPKKVWKPETQARFLYPSGGSGKNRLVVLSSWTIRGNIVTGIDEKKGGKKRSFSRDKIIRWLPSTETASEFVDPKPKPQSRMFKKLGSRKLLRQKQTAEGFEVGYFQSAAAKVANTHDKGLTENGIKYPKRELLGMTPADIEKMLDAAEEMTGL